MTLFARATFVVFLAVSFQAFGAGQESPQPPPPPPAPNAQQSAPPAQQPTPAPSPQNPAGTTGNQQQPATPPLTDEELRKQQEEILKKEQSQRVLGVVPQFSVTSRQHPPPLTAGQKFHLFAKSAFDPVQFGIVGLQAGIGQAENSFPTYGQGASGYGKRYGAAFADEISSNFFSNFAYPVLFKEDPRYFRVGEGSIKHRIAYSLAQEFVCRTDAGNRRFSYSNVLGAFTAGAISNVYYPPANRGFGLTMSRSGIALLYGSLGGLFDEFWTDIDQKLFHRKKQDAVTAQPPSKDH
ncbi:MAG TPA: hypothetical protein VIX19_02145 [Terriglobales bacterium]